MDLTVGEVLEGKVTGITKFGAFVELPEKRTGMVHISEVASSYVKDIKDFLTLNQTVKVKVLSIGDDGKISLSIKKTEEREKSAVRPSLGPPDSFDFTYGKTKENMSFEDMLNKFKQMSDDKMSDLKKILDVKRGSANRRVYSK